MDFPFIHMVVSGDFDAGNDLYAARRRFRARRALRDVMVRDGDAADTQPRGVRNNLFRLLRTVGKGRMTMQIARHPVHLNS